MEILKLKLEKAVSTFNTGDKATKELLISLYGEEHFLTNIKDRLTGYASACKILNLEPCTLEQFMFMGEKKAKKQFARYKIATGIEAINQGWVPDFENENQWKYYVWMYNKKRGFRSVVVGGCHYAPVGSDLYMENNANAEHIAKVFRDEYIEYLF